MAINSPMWKDLLESELLYYSVCSLFPLLGIGHQNNFFLKKNLVRSGLVNTLKPTSTKLDKVKLELNFSNESQNLWKNQITYL